MFKGLKSKLEDEAKKLQATVSQYGENIVQQVRSGVNDAGSDASEQVRRLFNSGTVNSSSSHPSSVFGDESGNYYDTGQLNEQNANSSAMMQEISENDVFIEPRQRYNSSSSIESESSFSNLFSFIPGMLNPGQRLSTISSDVESESAATSSQFQSASKEQISTVLHKLQGRAANYKDKYRKLVQMYNDLARENEKYRSVLATTQDKALERINKLREKNRELTEKMQEMELGRKNKGSRENEVEESRVKKLQVLVEKCNSNIEEKNERIRNLTEESEKLRKNFEQEISNSAVQRVTAEWKSRMDYLEEEWSKRLSDSEEASTLAIAKVKADMHRALEEKDGELQVFRAKCKDLELSGTEAQRQINELKAIVDALENEKADMIEKLSEAKLQGVNAVRCEEEEKRQNLKKEMEKKRALEKEQDERLFQEMIAKNNEQWALKFKEQEEQMQLAIEEREMQKVAAVMVHDQKNESLGFQVEQLTAEKLYLESVLEDMKERHRQQMEELSISIEANKERHEQEIIEAKNEEKELVAALKKDFEAAMKSNKKLQDELKELKNSKQKVMEGTENRDEKLISELVEGQIIDHLKRQNENEINKMRMEISALKENYEKILEDSITKDELVQRNAEMSELKQKLSEFSQRLSNKKMEIQELYGKLEQKAATIMNKKSGRKISKAKLASTQELSKIHQHLQQQLKVVQMERDETEKKYLEMEEKVQKAAQKLEVDRQILQQQKQQLEDKLHSHQLTETKMSKSEAEKMKCKTDQTEPKDDSILSDKVNFFELVIDKETGLKSGMDIPQQDLVFAEDVELKESCLSDGKEQPSLKADNLNEKDEVLEDLRAKLILMENEKSLHIANIEALEKNLQDVIEEKNNMMEEMADIHVNRDNLKIKMEEMETNVRETLSKKDLEIERLTKELRNQIDETNNVRSAVVISENELNETSSRLDEVTKKNEELEAMNEKLKTQFVQKANFANELQKMMKEQGVEKSADLESLKETLRGEQKRQLTLEKELAETKQNLDKTKTELQERKNNEEFLEIELNKKKSENEEELKMRNQYAVALKNANDDLEDKQKQLANLDLVRIEKDRLIAELSVAKEDCERVIQQLKQECEKREEKIKEKMEQKISEMKQQYERIGTAAKAEFLLQIDGIRSKIAEKDLQIEEQKINISSLEQKLLHEEQNKKIIADLRATIQAISNERDAMFAEMESQLNCMRIAVEETKKQLESQSQQITSLQEELESVNAENTRLRESTEVAEQLREERKTLLHEKENFEKEMERLQLEIVTAQKTASEESAKISAKVESERHRLLRDLQKEIKQLYHDLNERTQQLTEAQSKLQELSAKKIENVEIEDICAETDYKTDVHGKLLRTNSDFNEQADYDELCVLREQVAEYQKQLENMKENHKEELTLLCKKAYSTEQFNVIGLESVTNKSFSKEEGDSNDNNTVFAEPTEAEYLRNVLYRYMNERETLGKESVTLARVIATVARFTREQVNEVVAKEEQRNYGWVGGTVQSLISTAANLSSR